VDRKLAKNGLTLSYFEGKLTYDSCNKR